MGWTGKQRAACVWLVCGWLIIGCGVNRTPIAGLSGDGGSSSGDGGLSGSSGSGGISGSGGTSGVGGSGGTSGSGATGGSSGTSGSSGSGGTSGVGGSGGTSGSGGSGGVSTDASLDSATRDASITDANLQSDAGDAGAPIHPDSCTMFRPTASFCPNGWTMIAGHTCRRVCTGVAGLGTCGETMVLCPSGIGCEVSCEGVNTCPGKTIVCADGPCSVSCTGVNSCAGVTMQCSTDRCEAQCASVMIGSVTLTNMSTSCAAADGC